MTPSYLKTSYQVFGKLLCPDTSTCKAWEWHSSLLSGCLTLSAPRTISVRVSFTVFPPHLKDLVKTDPPRLSWCLGVPRSDRKSGPWLVGKASFKRVAPHKPRRACHSGCQLPLSWGKWRVCSVLSRHWENVSAQPEYTFLYHPYSSVLESLPLWSLVLPNHIAANPSLSRLHEGQPRAVFTHSNPPSLQ